MVGIVGATVLALGLAMLVLPGPGLLVIPVGLMILATEFVWARRWLQRIRGNGRTPAPIPIRKASCSVRRQTKRLPTLRPERAIS